MERRLYRICKEQKITYITIAHRPALKSYHDQARKQHLTCCPLFNLKFTETGSGQT